MSRPGDAGFMHLILGGCSQGSVTRKGRGPALLEAGILDPGGWVGDGDGARCVGDVGGAPGRTVVG